MKHAIGAMVIVVAMAGGVWAHGTRERPATPSELKDEFIVHRLKLLGYSEVQIVRSAPDSVDVSLQRGGTGYTATITRKLTGPGSLVVVNAAEVVEQQLRPVVLVPSPSPIIVR